ncbi:SPOR domain-containing protein [Pseudothauera rhizosphaerae]|uniref:SPOR domain-containing protein n=1 Tax=Pseudothauera rhizosphaerae TaxID=2565932 RepID=A0A4S4AMG8_9RHOO|nr:SPOR domain-containing protein [Pseudothauera rhizosphaerae]THF60232.1 hypothetical protein E6O51_15025 [Pseudothauera rhizosphaerae]
MNEAGGQDGTGTADAALRRALIAAVLAAALGVVLWLTGAGEPETAIAPAPADSAAPAPALPSAPAVDVDTPPVAPVQGADLAPPPVAAVQAETPPPAPVALPEAVAVAPPPGPVVQLGVFGARANAERLRDDLAQAGFPARIESRVVLGPFPDRAAAQAAQAGLPAGYAVQLGVFGAWDEAERLRDELTRAGSPARIENRVVLGPFPDRAVAEAAQAGLKRAGRSAGIVVPPR